MLILCLKILKGSLFRKCRFVVFGVTYLVKNRENSTDRSLNIDVSMANITKANEQDQCSMKSLFHPNPRASGVSQTVAFPLPLKIKHVSISYSSFVYPQYLAASIYLVHTSENSEKETLSVVKALDSQVLLPMQPTLKSSEY